MRFANDIKKTKLFLFDMDGTLYLGNQLFPCTLPLLQTIKEKGGRYLFMTNNSSKSVLAYVEKLKKLGIEADENDFMTSSMATVAYLNEHHKGARLYVCGTQSLMDELTRAGFTVTQNKDETDCIVMGFDTELNFQKLLDISEILCTRDLPYIATNPDYVCPTEFGSVPDCGSVCDMIYNATKKRPVVIGKPEARMPLAAMAMCGVTPAETAVIGDRIYTDIKSGLNAGALSILVMSGETTKEILDASEDKPDYVIKDCGEITAALKA